MNLNNVNYKCFVHMCENSKSKNPEKIFFTVPKDVSRRVLWFKAARTEVSRYSNVYCCSDHFDLKEDMINYVRYSLLGAPTTLKFDSVPHIFDCQPDRKSAHTLKTSKAAEKLNRKRDIEEILKESNQKKAKLVNQENISQNIQQQAPIYQLENAIEEPRVTSNDQPNIEQVNLFQNESTCANQVMHSNVTSSSDNLQRSSNSLVDQSITALPQALQSYYSKKEKSSVLSFGQSAPRKHYRSKGITCKPLTRDAVLQVKPLTVDRGCSPISIPSISKSSSSNITSSQTESSKNSELYQPTPEEISEKLEREDLEMKRLSLTTTLYHISRDPKFYIGVPMQWIWIIDEMTVASSMTSDQIKLILMKIRLNDQFKRLGDQFGLCLSSASRIFNNYIKKVSSFLKVFIFCPSLESMKKNLPIPFRLRYSNIVGIIDCFEIQIERPENPLHQSLTWSEYKKCNTLKYLNCISPDGLIIFISKGYGGRVSDMELFKDCGIMDVLPEKSTVMADRGFKSIDVILKTKNIQLSRPPSVSSDKKLTKEEAILTKRIASLRIHVERVIRRYREFSLLRPHSTIDHYNIINIDEAILIASALINLQNPVIKI